MKTVMTAAIVASLLGGSVALADPPERRGSWDNSRKESPARADQRRDNDRRDERNHRGNDRRDNDRDRNHGRDDRRDDRRDHSRNDNRRDWNDRDGRWHNNRDVHVHRYYSTPPRYRIGRYYAPRDYYYHSWRRGERLPYGWYTHSYVVHDYHRYNLRRPPHGYHWVRVDGDVILAAVASGIIADVVLNWFY